MPLDQIKKLQKKRENIELENQNYADGTPVLVDEYCDRVSQNIYQVDDRLNRYRVADDPGPYRDWISDT